MLQIPIDLVLANRSTGHNPAATIIGSSREGRPIEAFRLGHGSTRVSLIGGCHADEPVGPSMLRLLVGYLANLDSGHPLLEECRWYVVPHVNPDGAHRNAPWTEQVIELDKGGGRSDHVYDPALYVQNVVREPPGDDIEFGFPREPSDTGARPENRAVAEFLSPEAPFHLHGSFHGMGFAPGPWFLIEPAWVDRTVQMRQVLRHTVREMGYPLFDVDRQGDKGFWRIDEGFSTRPDSGAMRDHFLAVGDEEMAGKFRPSSMELVRALGGDPMTFVSEMPLFLIPESEPGNQAPGFKVGTAGMRELHNRLRRIGTGQPIDSARAEMSRLGIRGMPTRHQMGLQLSFLQEALNSVRSDAPEAPPE